MKNIVKGEDGVYRWVYELKLLKNPTILFLLWKIFGFILLGVFVLTMLFDMGNPDYWWDGFLTNLKVFAIIGAGMLALTLLGYLLYAAIMGGKYCVIFEMDENGVRHTQLPYQAKKAELIGNLTTIAGALAGNPTTVGIGLTSSARTSMYSDFSKVRRVKSSRMFNTIKVNELLEKNQVYAEKEDYDFVLGFICRHCKNAKLPSSVKALATTDNV